MFPSSSETWTSYLHIARVNLPTFTNESRHIAIHEGAWCSCLLGVLFRRSIPFYSPATEMPQMHLYGGARIRRKESFKGLYDMDAPFDSTPLFQWILHLKPFQRFGLAIHESISLLELGLDSSYYFSYSMWDTACTCSIIMDTPLPMFIRTMR